MKAKNLSPEILALIREPIIDEPDGSDWPMPEALLRNRREWKKLREQLRTKAVESIQSVEGVVIPVADIFSIVTGDDEQQINLKPRTATNYKSRWVAIAVAASVLGLVTIAISLFWSPGNEPPNEVPIVKKDQNTPQVPAPANPQPIPGDRQLKEFQEAMAALEKRASAVDVKEFRVAYEALLKKYPNRNAEIETNPIVAAALKRAASLAMVKNVDPVPTPVPTGDTVRDGLLAQIEPFSSGKPVPVSNEKVRGLRNDVIRYQQEHADTKIPKMEAFLAASEPTARNEFLYAEARTKELLAAPKDAAEVRELRNVVLTLRLRDDTRTQTVQSKPIIEFMKVTQLDEPAAKTAEMKTQVVTLVDRLSKPKERSPYLFCVLPPGIRGEAIDLYKNIQSYSRSSGNLPDAGLLDFVIRSRRPLKQDTLGMIIPMYVFPDVNNPGPWNQVLALGNQGVRIKVIINPNLDNAVNADPAYVTIINIAHQKGIEVLGRISCLGDAQAQVAKWHNLFPNMLDGLFFADQQTDIALIKPYAALYQFARGLEGQWQIVACPGSSCKEAFLTETRADLICQSITGGSPQGEGWMANHDPERFVTIVTDVIDPTRVAGLLMDAAEKHFGWVFVGGQDPFRVMPPYLNVELNWIQEMNNRILFGNGEIPPRRLNAPAPAKAKTRKPASPVPK